MLHSIGTEVKDPDQYIAGFRYYIYYQLYVQNTYE